MLLWVTWAAFATTLQIADDLLRRPSRQSRAIAGHSRTVVIPFTLLTSSPNGIELLVGRKIEVYATNLSEMLTYCRARA